MSSTILIHCDRCDMEIAKTATTFVEFHVGKHRARKTFDLCAECYGVFVEWLNEYGQECKGE